MNIYKIILLSLVLTPLVAFATISSGTIDSANKNALICHSVDCVTPTPGIINFKSTGGTAVTIDDTNGIDGVAWGNTIGWINFDPTGPEGLTINPSTGLISGKAWSQVSGWINFSPTGQTVKINNDGEFEGWAWTGGVNGGWIKFDCSFADACVKTDWRPISSRSVATTSTATTGTPTGASGGSTSANNINNDTCLNLAGIQSSLPSGYAQDQGGICVLNIDYCKNIEGIQFSIPLNHVLNGSGQCVLLTNENKNEFIPNFDRTKVNQLNGQEIEEFTDFCPNLFGLQSELPTGYTSFNGDCIPEEVDYCPNILGQQLEIPKDMKISNDGYCIKMSVDEIEEFNAIEKANNANRVLGYDFIPDNFVFEISIPFLGKILGFDYKVDLVSVVLTILAITPLYFVIRLIKINIG